MKDMDHLTRLPNELLIEISASFDERLRARAICSLYLALRSNRAAVQCGRCDTVRGALEKILSTPIAEGCNKTQAMEGWFAWAVFQGHTALLSVLMEEYGISPAIFLKETWASKQDAMLDPLTALPYILLKHDSTDMASCVKLMVEKGADPTALVCFTKEKLAPYHMKTPLDIVLACSNIETIILMVYYTKRSTYSVRENQRAHLYTVVGNFVKTLRWFLIIYLFGRYLSGRSNTHDTDTWFCEGVEKPKDMQKLSTWEKATYLHFAALRQGKGIDEILTLLFESYPELDLDVVDSYRNTPLWLAMRFGPEEAVEAFLRHGPSLPKANQCAMVAREKDSGDTVHEFQIET